jgi:hypothetical protein
MRTLHRKHRHTPLVDIHTIEDLAEATGLSVREIQGSLSTIKTRRALSLKRMVAECIDDAILSRCSAFLCQVLAGQTLPEPFYA